ncbi:winged helix-turn-helix domain-containing protein, partial [Lacticaseibacillus saniviri]|uniref:winged helix-turn-helix domain-containing protein n=1 Tax=Lacticaseibacillus saniviri TaxID=931533 RepID=UPI001EE07980
GIKAIERRTASQPAPVNTGDQLVVGDLAIDEQNFKATKAGQRLQLTPKEFELLVYFAKHLGKTLSRDALLNGIWGFEYPAETRMVDIQVSHLRDKIETDPKHPVYLKTIRGFGYQMEVPQ